MTREEIQDRCPEEPLLFADGFDDAIIGTASVNGITLVTYSTSKCIEILGHRDGLSYDHASEYFYYNVSGAYVGERTPIFVEDD